MRFGVWFCEKGIRGSRVRLKRPNIYTYFLRSRYCNSGTFGIPTPTRELNQAFRLKIDENHLNLFAILCTELMPLRKGKSSLGNCIIEFTPNKSILIFNPISIGTQSNSNRGRLGTKEQCPILQSSPSQLFLLKVKRLSFEQTWKWKKNPQGWK